MPEISADGVRKSLGGLLTLKNINIKVENESVTGILGPSGCGKTTLFNIISGLMMPDSGRITFGGRDVTGQTGWASYMQQKDLLLPSRTVLDNAIIPLLLKGISRKEARAAAQKHLSQFGLEGFGGYYPTQLSGGMKQRAALLRTYLFSSEIWLLDEPFASLDAITKKKMHQWLVNMLKELRPTVLFITHDIDEALYLCDKIYVLSECPTVVRLEVKVPFCRPDHTRTIVDSHYQAIRDSILEALAV